MAFIVEDGTGVAGATSYASVLEADNQLGLNPNNTAWSSLTVGDKENYLIWATQVLDHIVRWNGNKVAAENTLAWPRIYVIDCEGYSISSTELPFEVKEATIILANSLLDSNNDPAVFDENSVFKRIKVDVIELEYRDGVTRQKIPAYLRQVLRCLGRVQGGSGHNFVPITKV